MPKYLVQSMRLKQHLQTPRDMDYPHQLQAYCKALQYDTNYAPGGSTAVLPVLQSYSIYILGCQSACHTATISRLRA